MPKKIYKITPSQAKSLAEHIKKTKGIVNEGMSPEAAQYYAANPEALAEKLKQEEEEAAKLAEQQPQQATDPVQQIVQAATALAQQQNTGTANEPTKPTGATSTTKPPTGATSATGPQPAPTGNEPSPDSTEALQAKAATQNQTGVVDEDNQEGDAFEDIPNAPTPQSNEPVEAQAEEIFVTKLVQNNTRRDFYSLTRGAEKVFGIPPGMEVNDVLGQLDVQWTFNVEKAPDLSGIAGLKIEVSNVVGTVKAEYMDEQDNYQYGNAIQFNAKSMGFAIQVDMTPDAHGFKPRSLDIDWAGKTITVD